MSTPSTIFEYITGEESAFESNEMQIGDNWKWNFRNHVQLIFHLKNGVFYTGDNNWLRAFKNIMDPILNLSYWSEDIEVKDVLFYVEGEADRVMSFLIKKYHEEIFVKKYNLDTMFDEITESDIDYGGVLVQKSNTAKPNVLALNEVAFCDQTDVLGGPIGFKLSFAPDKLREMAQYGWGNPKNGATTTIEDLIMVAEPEKQTLGANGLKNITSGKNIDAYIVRGNLPLSYLKDDGDEKKYIYQLQIVAFYYDKDGNRQGVTLYRKPEDSGNLKFHTSKKVSGRGLGRGVGESLLHPQIWTNFLSIHKMNLLEAASKSPLYTDDVNYTQKNKIQDMENLEVTTIEDGKRIFRVPTESPVNVQLFEKAISEWYEQAQLAGSAFDPLLGQQANSGTTFQGQNQVVQQGKGIHERRRGQRAKFIEELYRDWIIPDMTKEIIQGHTFLATLTWEEMSWAAGQLAESYANREVNDDVLKGRPIRDRDALKQQCIQEFSKRGNQHLIEILQGQFKDVAIRMGINIAGKQKDLQHVVESLTSVFQTITANPYILKQPAMEKLFNQIIEASGLDPIDLSGFDVPAVPARRMTETIDYKDLATPPNDAQKQMLTLAGITPPQAQPAGALGGM